MSRRTEDEHVDSLAGTQARGAGLGSRETVLKVTEHVARDEQCEHHAQSVDDERQQPRPAHREVADDLPHLGVEEHEERRERHHRKDASDHRPEGAELAPHASQGPQADGAGSDVGGEHNKDHEDEPFGEGSHPGEHGEPHRRKHENAHGHEDVGLRAPRDLLDRRRPETLRHAHEVSKSN